MFLIIFEKYLKRGCDSSPTSSCVGAFRDGDSAEELAARLFQNFQFTPIENSTAECCVVNDDGEYLIFQKLLD